MKMLLVYVRRGKDLISQKCEHMLNSRSWLHFGFYFRLHHVIFTLIVLCGISLAYLIQIT